MNLSPWTFETAPLSLLIWSPWEMDMTTTRGQFEATDTEHVLRRSVDGYEGVCLVQHWEFVTTIHWEARLWRRGGVEWFRQGDVYTTVQDAKAKAVVALRKYLQSIHP